MAALGSAAATASEIAVRLNVEPKLVTPETD